MAALINRAEEGLIALLLTTMTVLTFAQVIARYVFNKGWFWALEATTYMFGWLVLLGISYGVKAGFHIGIDLAVKALPARGQRIAGVLAALLCLLYAAIMAIGSINYVETMYVLGIEAEDIALPRWLLIAALPLGFLLLGYRLLELTRRILSGAEGGYQLGDEAADTLRTLTTGGDNKKDGNRVS